MGLLQDKVAIVTGSSKGIGKVIAHAFVREGARVVVTSSRQANVDAALREFPPDRVIGIQCDVADRQSVEGLLRQTVDTFGALDILVNNAGISDSFYNITDGDPEEWERIVDTNLKGTYYACRAAMAYFLESGRAGKIINMAGSGTDRGSNTPFISAYGSTKAALYRFTMAVAAEYRNSSVSIMLLHPGLVRTDIISTVDPTPEMQKQLKTFETIVDIFAQPPTVAARMAVKLASSWSDGKSGIYLSALSGWRKKKLLFSWPLRKLFNRIDRTTY
ncbi:SDR family NAD(P)-dependent oxidoreductase [Prosthecochloris vibrioformis]|uniref:SDR family oxidoreductase n=1 Tax=Prosthecochloris vibrioformis TaxID=1098 RepID=A0A5C4S5L4_PROVB|nr:SDR family oxidoreductase [Prosthecochloris vibrioformis]TNJ37991.1 SDR family oxidoreductase [Prosthecochloris vibrioformis]